MSTAAHSAAAYSENAQEAQTINQKEIEMRELTMSEIGLVSGAGDECSGGGNNYGGVSVPDDVGGDIVAIYEGLVAATSHIIERIANSF